MAAGGAAEGAGRWLRRGSPWVRGVLLLLGGLRAATPIPVSLSSSPPCRHHVPTGSEVINKVHLKANHVVKRAADDHLRIKTVYDKSIEDSYVLCHFRLLPEKRHLVKNKLFPQAISYLEKTFQVRRPAGTILLSRQCATNQYLRKENDPHRYCTGECAEATKCGPVTVPEEHLQPQEFIGMLSTVKHEIIHALGFSAGLFAFYHDKDGNPLTSRFADGLPPFNYSLGLYQWSDKVIRKVERSWHIRDDKVVPHTVHLLVTPRVVEEARKHFDCPVLEGMELENQGGMGTELNHWEKRLLENEAMTGSHTQNRVLSRITLALMEDTGWYKANYSMAEKLDWGRGEGCDFVRKSCKFWMDQQRQKRQTLSPYCNTLRSNPLRLTCRQDQRAVAVCNLQKFPKPLPREYQYFDELSGVPAEDLPYYGGSVEIADYCPFSQEFSWHLSGEYQRSSDCRILENQPDLLKNYGAEKYGPHSVCLIQKSAFIMEKCERKLSYPDWGSGCYQVSCSLEGLKVWVQDTSYLCSRAGQVLPVSIQMNGWIYDGNLICPSCWDFCELCPPERDPPVANLTRALPLDLCSRSSSLAAALWLLLGNLFPLLAGFLLCVWH
ncbi:leishmanolysin-like peptidase isoform X4 [Sorex araneus]|uniref:leishmanolysin-like peptidase isoform X4 n=1 Tax=Sorex araneus TaxID=42254 RepID=UPI0024336EC3|nr:leishmanolysin-like peptidase isoform X4 [Sorex araneus]